MTLAIIDIIGFLVILGVFILGLIYVMQRLRQRIDLLEKGLHIALKDSLMVHHESPKKSDK